MGASATGWWPPSEPGTSWSCSDRAAGQATELAARAVAGGAEVVAVLGGDGTVNEVVNGLRGSDAALALLGGGRVNVVARGSACPPTPTGPPPACSTCWPPGPGAPDPGVAGERCFALNAGLGLGGAIVREVERRQRAKQLYGDRAYVAAGLKALLVDYDRDHPHLTVHLPDGRPPLRGFFALVGNGDPFTYLGRRPFRPTPKATWDGGLDLLVGQTMATRSLARAVTGMLSPHPRAGYPGLPVLHDVDGFSLSADIPLPFQLDGEYVGDRTSVTFGSLRSALGVVAPQRVRNSS